MTSYWCCASSHETDDTGHLRRSQVRVQSDFADRLQPGFVTRGIEKNYKLAGIWQFQRGLVRPYTALIIFN